MSSNEKICPHCGSQHNRVLSDHQGSVGWCGDCHRAWVVPLHWPMGQTRHRPHPAERERRIA
ncbi:MAG: hypothetical protein H7Y60_14380 [Rhodospirillaceae bacterium]|nr:hypothetical protein [Rhodospirillales bacterium]